MEALPLQPEAKLGHSLHHFLPWPCCGNFIVMVKPFLSLLSLCMHPVKHNYQLFTHMICWVIFFWWWWWCWRSELCKLLWNSKPRWQACPSLVSRIPKLSHSEEPSPPSVHAILALPLIPSVSTPPYSLSTEDALRCSISKGYGFDDFQMALAPAPMSSSSSLDTGKVALSHSLASSPHTHLSAQSLLLWVFFYSLGLCHLPWCLHMRWKKPIFLLALAWKRVGEVAWVMLLLGWSQCWASPVEISKGLFQQFFFWEAFVSLRKNPLLSSPGHSRHIAKWDGL